MRHSIDARRAGPKCGKQIEETAEFCRHAFPTTERLREIREQVQRRSLDAQEHRRDEDRIGVATTIPEAMAVSRNLRGTSIQDS
jgi:hypothetical protein